MKYTFWILPLLLLPAALLTAPDACAQSAGEMFNKIAQEMTEDYETCTEGLKKKKDRLRAYVEHGKRAARRWQEFLDKHGDTRMAFNARLNLAQGLELAKELDRAKEVLNAAAEDANTLFRARELAKITQLVYRTKQASWDLIQKIIKTTDDIDDKAALHLDLIKYIDVPKKLKPRKMKAARLAYRRNKQKEIVTAVAKAYPKTDAGKEAGLMARGIDLAVGDVCPNLDIYFDMNSKPIDLNEYKGKVVLLHFWRASSSTKKYMPDLVGLVKTLEPKGLETVGINVDYSEDRHRADAMIDTLGIPWRNYHDGEKLYNRIVLLFYVRKFPFNIVIGKDGKVAAIGVKIRQLETVLAEHLAK